MRWNGKWFLSWESFWCEFCNFISFLLSFDWYTSGCRNWEPLRYISKINIFFSVSFAMFHSLSLSLFLLFPHPSFCQFFCCKLKLHKKIKTERPYTKKIMIIIIIMLECIAYPFQIGWSQFCTLFILAAYTKRYIDCIKRLRNESTLFHTQYILKYLK